MDRVSDHLPELVEQRFSQAPAQRCDVVLPLVAPVSRDRDDWRVLQFLRKYRGLPAWFRVHAVVAAAASAPPNAASVRVDAFGSTDAATTPSRRRPRSHGWRSGRRPDSRTPAGVPWRSGPGPGYAHVDRVTGERVAAVAPLRCF